MSEHEPFKSDPPEEDTLKLYIWQPVSRHQADVVITQAEALTFLCMSASEYWRRPCEDQHCEVCYEFVSSWKSLYQALDAHERATVETYLEATDIRAPAFPQAIR